MNTWNTYLIKSHAKKPSHEQPPCSSAKTECLYNQGNRGHGLINKSVLTPGATYVGVRKRKKPDIFTNSHKGRQWKAG